MGLRGSHFVPRFCVSRGRAHIVVFGILRLCVQCGRLICYTLYANSRVKKCAESRDFTFVPRPSAPRRATPTYTGRG